MQPVVLISGVLGGIGQAVGEQFVRGGWQVFGTDLDGAALAARQAAGQLAGYHAADLRQVGATRAVVAAAQATLGRLDALVNCAGVWREGPAETFSEEDFDLVLDVNLKASFFLCAAAIPALRETRGAIVNLSSDAGRQGNRNAAVYCASKGAVTLMTKALALDLAPSGVRCNAISPGDVATPMLSFQAERYGNGDPAGYLQDLLAKYPQGDSATFVQPDEVAALAFFLCQPSARSITGADLAIDRGISAGH